MGAPLPAGSTFSFSLAFGNVALDDLSRHTACRTYIIRLRPEMLFSTYSFEVRKALSQRAGTIAFQQVRNFSG